MTPTEQILTLLEEIIDVSNESFYVKKRAKKIKELLTNEISVKDAEIVKNEENE